MSMLLILILDKERCIIILSAEYVTEFGMQYSTFYHKSGRKSTVFPESAKKCAKIRNNTFIRKGKTNERNRLYQSDRR